MSAQTDDWEEVMPIDGRGMFLTSKYAIVYRARVHRLSLLDLRRGRPSMTVDLRSDEIRRLRSDQASGCRMGEPWHSGQCGGARNDQH